MVVCVVVVVVGLVTVVVQLTAAGATQVPSASVVTCLPVSDVRESTLQ